MLLLHTVLYFPYYEVFSFFNFSLLILYSFYKTYMSYWSLVISRSLSLAVKKGCLRASTDVILLLGSLCNVYLKRSKAFYGI